MKRLEDRIFDALREERGAFAADELARRFLGVAAGGRAAARIIEAALARDRRFRLGPEGWEAALAPAAAQALSECPWRVLLADSGPAGSAGARVLAVADFQPGETGSFAAAAYVTGPPDTVRETMAQLEAAAADLPVQALTDLKLWRLLDDLFVRPGLFLRGLRGRDLGAVLQAAEETGTGLPEHFYSLEELIRLVWPAGRPFSAEAAWDHFQIPLRREDPLLAELAALPQLLPRLIEELALAGVERLDELPARLEEFHRPLDLARYGFSRADLDGLPEAPGVYTLSNAAGQVIYVGKSVNLRRRVQGYFRWRADGDPKLERIQAETFRLAAEPLGSDLEALLEEAERIARFRPPINVQMEVHEAAREKGIQDPLVVLLPHRDEGKAALFLLHPAGGVQRLALDRPADPALLDRFLAAAERNEPFPGATAYGGGGFPLALRWLRKNSHRLTFFLYHDYPGRSDLVRVLLAALAEGKFAERQIFL